jgi:uncharacterized protein
VGEPAGRHRLLLNATELLRQPGTVRAISTTVPQADVDVDEPRLHGDIAIELTLTSTLDDIEVAGTLTVDWSDECRRCLAPLGGPLTLAVDERYAPASDDPGRRVDPEAFPIEHGQLDLAPMVREEVLLGVPDAPLCRDDCAGICPECGADLAAGPCGCGGEVRDERWAVLDQLRGEDAT